MGCALLKLPVPDSYSDLESLRAMAYKEVDKFIDRLAPLLDKKPTPTFSGNERSLYADALSPTGRDHEGAHLGSHPSIR
jgi:hypothetical protein